MMMMMMMMMFAFTQQILTRILYHHEITMKIIVIENIYDYDNKSKKKTFPLQINKTQWAK